MVDKLLYKELSYTLRGIFFRVHNKLGKMRNEKQYCDAIEFELKANNIPYVREYQLEVSFSGEQKGRNRVDFIIDNKIILEIKTVLFISREEYYQCQRYLVSTGLDLALLINFRSKYLTIKRILNHERLKPVKQISVDLNTSVYPDRNPSMPATEKQIVGAWGEEQASLFLIRHGYTIVERNYRTKMGELDIIAWQFYRNQRTLCFIEVKTRGYGVGSAERATQGPKLPRMFASARQYCISHGINMGTTPIQFEHVSVYVNKYQKTLQFKKYIIPVE